LVKTSNKDSQKNAHQRLGLFEGPSKSAHSALSLNDASKSEVSVSPQLSNISRGSFMSKASFVSKASYATGYDAVF